MNVMNATEYDVETCWSPATNHIQLATDGSTHFQAPRFQRLSRLPLIDTTRYSLFMTDNRSVVEPVYRGRMLTWLSDKEV